MQIQITAAAITIITLLFNSPLFSQTGPPDTEIYLLEMTNQSGKIRLGPPRNITNRVGYDNQPFFLPSGEAVLYTSIGADGQADIYQYSLADKKNRTLNEYAGERVLPNADAGRTTLLRGASGGRFIPETLEISIFRRGAEFNFEGDQTGGLSRMGKQKRACALHPRKSEFPVSC